MKKIVNNLAPDRTQNFTYDSLNRIREAWTSGNLWGNYFGDAFSATGRT